MSYEIPAALKYEEKIIFNLSMRQSAWLGLFTLVALVIFSRLRLAVEVRATAAILTIMLGFGFAFLDFRPRLSALIGFFGRPRQHSYFDKRMAAFTGIGRVCSDAIFMKDGQAKAVIRVQPINFSVLSDSHRKSIVLAYRDFLNSLDFPIQIAVRTVDLSMGAYFDALESRARFSQNRKAAERLKGFREFTEEYIRLKGAKNRLFYIVVPSERVMEAGPKILGLLPTARERHEIGKTGTLEILNGRVKACIEKLQNCGLISWRLRDEELLSLFSGYFDCMIEAKEGYLSAVTSLEGTTHGSPGNGTGATLPRMTAQSGFITASKRVAKARERPRTSPENNSTGEKLLERLVAEPN